MSSPEAETNFYEVQDGIIQPTAKGLEILNEIVTNPESNVYAFQENPYVSMQTIAIAMARTSRSVTPDLGATILKEFLDSDIEEKTEHTEAFSNRILLEYGDESVKQIAPLLFAARGISQIGTKGIERSRIGVGFIESSTRYINYSLPDQNGKLRYTTPPEIQDHPEALKNFTEAMNQLFEYYGQLFDNLIEYVRRQPPAEGQSPVAYKQATFAKTCDALRGLLPIATTGSVSIQANAQAVENMVLRLQSSPLRELQILGTKILEATAQVSPNFMRAAQAPDKGGAIINFRQNKFSNIKMNSRSFLKMLHLPEPEIIKKGLATLIDYYPKNELELVPYILHTHSQNTLEQIIAAVTEQLDPKFQQFILEDYLADRQERRQKPGRVLENARYTFQATGDIGSFRDLQRHRIVDDFEWQVATPHIGYNIHPLVIEAGFKNTYKKALDVSRKAYESLISFGYDPLIAQYSVSMAYQMNYRLSFNARQAFHMLELRTAIQGIAEYRKLCQQMYHEVAKVHPIIASGMIFMGLDEDQALPRLQAAQRFQDKLKNQ